MKTTITLLYIFAVCVSCGDEFANTYDCKKPLPNVNQAYIVNYWEASQRLCINQLRAQHLLQKAINAGFSQQHGNVNQFIHNCKNNAKANPLSNKQNYRKFRHQWHSKNKILTNQALIEAETQHYNYISGCYQQGNKKMLAILNKQGVK